MKHTTLRRTAAIISSLGLAIGLAACGSDNESSTAVPSTESSSASESAALTGTVKAANQDGDGSTLTVSSVDLEGVEQGWIAVHSDVDGKPGPVVGNVQVEQGTSSDVVVELDDTVATGDYFTMLHVDDGEVGTFEFPDVEGVDLPVLDGEMPVMQKLTLTVN
ncbi:hypothetical protein M3G32_06565 [Corynebacterium sanguinis]|uniref:DUF7282 domain-containing protein n=1 Tax=Corynebacterium sanguinis TaxID=2594913 RepID=UPI00119F904E|nr:hypothetical protein [Corynebacterium sanguinis]MCT1499381.1 hypothetical protein [Corynebacterium sanguinis]